MTRSRLVALALACTMAAPLHAQGATDDARRPVVQAFQRRIHEVVQRTLDATDDQMRQLAEVNRRYQSERRELNRKDRDARGTIRAEVLRDSLADEDKVARMLDQLVEVQRQRIDIFAREQRDLARFLTPVQRAKYATLQEGLRKKVEQLKQRQQDNGLTPLQRRRLRQLRRMGDTTG
jgi:P pilus assembly/Cpx signaling pathway, periplasmic inhibitor/zinc-resistance associated protein